MRRACLALLLLMFVVPTVGWAQVCDCWYTIKDGVKWWTDNCGQCNQYCGDQGGCRNPGISIACREASLLYMTASLSRVSGPPGNFWAVGAEYAGVSTGVPSFDIENFYAWGTGISLGLQLSEVGIVFAIEAGDQPNLRKLRVKSFTATVPSLVHSATAPNATGVNVYSLRGGFLSRGEINIVTGEVTLRLSAQLRNDYYPEGSEIPVTIDLEGTINPTTSTAMMIVKGVAHEREE